MQNTNNIINKQAPHKIFLFFLLAWFLINLVQAILTEVNTDETVYFVWGKYPDWGYFDHPPLVGLITHISSLLFNGNLGVRFLTLLLQPLSLFLLWLLVDKKDNSNRAIITFYIISASLVMFSAYGFITTPDVPLLFFTALFLYGYKRFLAAKDWISVFILAISMAGMVYSKYHGVLVIGFVVLSNVRLLVNWKFWLAGILALLFCAPHFLWLYQNDFPSFKYQFAAFDLKFSHFIEYLPGQLAAFNPFTLGAVIYILFRNKPINEFERSLYFIIIGFLIFFWALAYKGQVQAQWTVAASIPMIILLNNKIAINERLFNYSRKFIAPTLLLILAARIILTTDLLPAKMGFSGKATQYNNFEKTAGDKPVIFTRAYQQAALYSFFTGKRATSISSLVIRQSQFDLWKFDQVWRNDSVYVVLQDNRSNIYEPKKEEITTFFADHLQTPNGLKIQFQIQEKTFHTGDSLTADFAVENRTSTDINFKDSIYHIDIIPVFRDRSGFVFRGEGKLRDPIDILKSREKISNQIKLFIPGMPAGNYQMGLSCNYIFGPANNSNFFRINIIH